MGQTTVRVESIEIANFKNVSFGKLVLENTKPEYRASILGLYGQNGSGKTALIDALELLKLVLSGKSIPSFFADYINVDSAFATLKYGFKVEDSSKKNIYHVFYEVCLRKDINDSEYNTKEIVANPAHKVTLFDEVLSYSCESNGKKSRLSPIIDTRSTSELPFVPKVKYNKLIGREKEAVTNLTVAKQLACETSRSFIFSKSLLNQIRKNCTDDSCQFLIESLIFFGNYRLFVINTTNTGLISMNILPLAFNYAEHGTASVGNLMLKLDEPSSIPEGALSLVHKVVNSMNIVLNQLIPGLTIDVKTVGQQLQSNGAREYLVQLISRKNSREIPLRYESEGIKKLVSVLQLLIVAYNEPCMTVAIDELDSGIFEYLLGEILRILSEKGKGQLIFTSHNLRPLETIDKSFIAFTTTNPHNRYIRLCNVKATNNLRDFYYRDIVLGSQSESVYEPTNNSEIAMAFREAGIRDDT